MKPKRVFRSNKAKDNLGKRFGLLTVVGAAGRYQKKWPIWLCRCDCGKMTKARASCVIGGHTKSCGCALLEAAKKRRGPKGESGFYQLFLRYKYAAKTRGYSFKLTKEQFRTLVQAPCSYCGREATAVAHNGGTDWSMFRYTGVDRLDNTLGYLPSNSVSACGACNKAKSVMGAKEFIDHVRLICSNLSASNWTVAPPLMDKISTPKPEPLTTTSTNGSCTYED